MPPLLHPPPGAVPGSSVIKTWDCRWKECWRADLLPLEEEEVMVVGRPWGRRHSSLPRRPPPSPKPRLIVVTHYHASSCYQPHSRVLFSQGVCGHRLGYGKTFLLCLIFRRNISLRSCKLHNVLLHDINRYLMSTSTLKSADVDILRLGQRRNLNTRKKK